VDNPRELLPLDFERYVGSAFEMRTDGGSSVLQLRSVKLNKPHHMRAQPFELVFHGQGAQPIPQGSYPFIHTELGQVEMFIVPSAKLADGFEYLVVFN
jgi:hypothetical protein